MRVDFGVSGGTGDQVLSFDVVPAFADGDAYTIPDRRQGDWIKTNPRVHAEQATAANQALDKRWKPLVKMVKKWNDHNDRPVKPSFLLEVMALDLENLAGAAPTLGSSGSSSPRPPRPSTRNGPIRLASDRLCLRASLRILGNSPRPRQRLAEAEAACTEALRLEQSGRTGAALDAWQALFGSRFAKS